MQRLLFVSLFCVLTSANGQVTVNVDQDAVLPCSPSTKENIETSVFDWKKGRQEVFLYNGGEYYGHGLSGQDKQFEGRVSHFNEELKNGNASIKIRKTKMADSGNYTCILPRLKPPQQFIIELVVVACRKPYVKPLRETSDQAVLQCVVKGASPEAKVEWRDSSGNILHADEPQVTKNKDGSYDIILQTTVTKTDTYSCVVTQDAICHQVSNDLHVDFHAPAPPVGWIVAAVVIPLLLVAIFALLYKMGCIKLECKKNQTTRQTEKEEEKNLSDVKSES